MRGKIAPQLFHDKPDPKKGANFMFYPQDLLRAINHLCTYNEQRLLLTLLGCKGDGSFSPSTVRKKGIRFAMMTGGILCGRWNGYGWVMKPSMTGAYVRREERMTNGADDY